MNQTQLVPLDDFLSSRRGGDKGDLDLGGCCGCSLGRGPLPASRSFLSTGRSFLSLSRGERGVRDRLLPPPRGLTDLSKDRSRYLLISHAHRDA